MDSPTAASAASANSHISPFTESSSRPSKRFHSAAVEEEEEEEEIEDDCAEDNDEDNADEEEEEEEDDDRVEEDLAALHAMLFEDLPDDRDLTNDATYDYVAPAADYSSDDEEEEEEEDDEEEEPTTTPAASSAASTPFELECVHVVQSGMWRINPFSYDDDAASGVVQLGAVRLLSAVLAQLGLPSSPSASVLLPIVRLSLPHDGRYRILSLSEGGGLAASVLTTALEVSVHRGGRLPGVSTEDVAFALSSHGIELEERFSSRTDMFVSTRLALRDALPANELCRLVFEFAYGTSSRSDAEWLVE